MTPLSSKPASSDFAPPVEPQRLSMDDSHAPHHIHEFGEVDRIVHVAPSESSVADEALPVAPIAQRDPAARSERWKRLGRRLHRERHLMQYFYNDILYRTPGLRKVTTEELFLDLVIVGAIAALGHELRAAEISWTNVEKFMLLFFAIYYSWQQVVILWNLWGVKQDLLEKLGIYLTFASLIGIALGAHGAFEDGVRPYVAACSFAASAIPIAGGLRWSASEKLLKNPANRVNQWGLNSLFALIAITPYFAAAFVGTSQVARILFWIAGGLQLGFSVVPYQVYRFLHRKAEKFTRLAVNIELFVEKFEVLTMIVLGETVIGLLFEGGAVVTAENVRVGHLYLAAFGATAMLYSLQTLYVQVDSPIQKGGKHAIRHSSIAGILWGAFHMPYHFFLILFATGLSIGLRDIAIPPTADAAARILARADEPGTVAATAAQFTRNARWIFSVGWGGSMICSGLLGMLHVPGPRAATKIHRIIIRFVISVAIMVGMPFADLSAGRFQAVFVAVTVCIGLAEMICVQMDRIGFFRSEGMPFTSTDDSKENRLDHDFDSTSESSDTDPDLDIDIEATRSLDGIDFTEGGAHGQNGADEALAALQARCSRGHCARLVAVKSAR